MHIRCQVDGDIPPTQGELFMVRRTQSDGQCLTWIGLYRYLFRDEFNRNGACYGAGVWLDGSEGDGHWVVKFLRIVADRLEPMLPRKYYEKWSMASIDPGKLVKKESLRKGALGYTPVMVAPLEGSGEGESLFLDIAGRHVEDMINAVRIEGKYTTFGRLFLSCDTAIVDAARTGLAKVVRPDQLPEVSQPTWKAQPCAETSVVVPAPASPSLTAGTATASLPRSVIEYMVINAIREHEAREHSDLRLQAFRQKSFEQWRAWTLVATALAFVTVVSFYAIPVVLDAVSRAKVTDAPARQDLVPVNIGPKPISAPPPISSHPSIPVDTDVSADESVLKMSKAERQVEIGKKLTAIKSALARVEPIRIAGTQQEYEDLLFDLGDIQAYLDSIKALAKPISANPTSP